MAKAQRVLWLVIIEGGHITQYMGNTTTVSRFYISYCIAIRKNPEAKCRYFQVKINSYLS